MKIWRICVIFFPMKNPVGRSKFGENSSVKENTGTAQIFYKFLGFLKHSSRAQKFFAGTKICRPKNIYQCNNCRHNSRTKCNRLHRHAIATTVCTVAQRYLIFTRFGVSSSLSVSLVYAAAAAAALVVGAYYRKWSCIVRRRGVDF